MPMDVIPIIEYTQINVSTMSTFVPEYNIYIMQAQPELQWKLPPSYECFAIMTDPCFT